MPDFYPKSPVHAGLRTSFGPVRPGQPLWNPQRTSSMPSGRYVRTDSRRPRLTGRAWPAETIEHAPLWCSVDLRDGNQALVSPMNLERKSAMFDLLVTLGFKEIEVGYPAASETDFSFVRDLIKNDRIPDDVTVSVFTQGRADLIDRTFEAIQGLDHGMVHLCLATACLWRELVLDMSADELRKTAVSAAEQVARHAAAMPNSRLRYEFSPETFNVTEPDYVLEVSSEVAATWTGCGDQPITLNFPSTVETDSPNVYADQIEWMHRNLPNRESIILSVHPHNDRGTAVASAELAVMAGADRIEGTLFGNGERTGNVCLATLALNLFSRGVDPQLDFSNINAIRHIVEFCNQIPVHPRHPYVGDLVYTAFSGTHQDAIAKGFAALEAQAARTGQDQADLPWEVPYLPIDPKDVGRTYESVIRVNSQSGKGGVAHVLKSAYGLDMPRGLRIEFAALVQRLSERTGVEVNSRQLWEAFVGEYLEPRSVLLLKSFQQRRAGDRVQIDAHVALADGHELEISGSGESPATAFADALRHGGWAVEIRELVVQTIAGPADPKIAAYAYVAVNGTAVWGAGMDTSIAEATFRCLLSSVNRAVVGVRGAELRQAG